MNVIVFGLDRPQVSYRQDPSGAINFGFENDLVVYLDAQDAGIIGKTADDMDVLWADVYLSLLHNRNQVDLELWDEESSFGKFQDFVEEDLRPSLSTDSERRFFDLYVDICWKSCRSAEDLWHLPALIPQVWVNWIHFDSRSRERAERAQREPFRVDFALRTNDTRGMVAIEIDGSSHFGGRSFVGGNGGVIFEASMEAYTQHLRRDRWLRNQGWRVVRISNLEIDEIEDATQFQSLLAEILNVPKLADLRLKLPWEWKS